LIDLIFPTGFERFSIGFGFERFKKDEEEEGFENVVFI